MSGKFVGIFIEQRDTADQYLSREHRAGKAVGKDAQLHLRDEESELHSNLNKDIK